MADATRRGFLGLLGLAAAAPALVEPSALLPAPGPLTVVLPPAMPSGTEIVIRSQNSMLTIHQISRETIRLFRESNVMLEYMRHKYESDLEFCREERWDV